VDLHRHALTRDGETVNLSPRLVQLLGHLASHPGRVVPKEALLERFWADVHVAENTLDRAITRIRKALGDDPARPTYIQTVPRRGYQFVAAVDESGAPPQPDALDLWTKGRLSLEALNVEQLADATEAFERVLAANAHSAPAHAALANAYFLQFEVTRPETTPDRALLERALTHARRACVEDSSSGEAWATLGFLLAGAGDVSGARTAARRAVSLQPLSWRHQFRLSMACWGQERLDAIDRTLSLMPDFAPARLVAAMVFIARGALPAAEALVVKGAARQSLEARYNSVSTERGTARAEGPVVRERDTARVEGPFPAFGLHWLRGLLQLRHGEVAPALESFEREVTDARPTSIYFREYCVNALVGSGYAHLAAARHAAAMDAFHAALERMPSNGRALLGLQRALARRRRATDAASLAPRLATCIGELASAGRGAEAAMLRAGVEAARGNADAACDVLARLLEDAPLGQTGWMIPIDPALALLRGRPSFDAVLTLLSARAA
jgi:DNA-binding winged helix-turn-helix (wHTH) protein/Tfp pilus assembly protein PilF